ncbi:MAG: helix-turn-helix transcriptional regulator [Phycisphaerae bacterium]|nr:helix-turn-helix transcriptional regulator [Phycisphaerae bacterium]
MADAREALAQRIRELRRRHFGASGKAAFAQKLGLPLEDYAKFEEGVVPAGDVLVRICETTGEDLQWLLTGEAARGSVVISGARHRHRDLITRLAQALDEKPELAAPIEAFVDLLLRGEDARRTALRALQMPAAEDLIPLLAARDAPETWPELPITDRANKDPSDPDVPGPGRPRPSRRPQSLAPGAALRATRPLLLAEPGAARAALSAVKAEQFSLVEIAPAAGAAPARFLHVPRLARDFPAALAIELPDDAMSPLLQRGDAALISPEFAPRVGEPAICRLRSLQAAICRVWLSESDDEIIVGRVGDGERERYARSDLCWSAGVLFRLAPAA